MSSSSSTSSTSDNNINVVEIENQAPVQPPQAVPVEQQQEQQPFQVEQQEEEEEEEEEEQPFNNNDLTILCRVAISALLIFILTIIFTFFIWFIFHPNFPQLRISTASISRLNISKHNTITAECNVTLLLSNTNRHLFAVYERMEFSLIYPSQRVLLSQFYGTPFLQPRKNCTGIEIGFGFRDVFLGSDVVKALKKDVMSGSLILGVKVIGIVSYKYGNLTTQTQFMRAYCGDLVFMFSGNGDIGRLENVGRECQVYLFTE